ncbi:Translocon-associated protein beta [Ancylostoma duodenale]|uniref:Translocon-associated protein beta n=1 Tax=Ancylostoma duodenale TaxID=51022 RepID=A0A0C2F7L3_9BILA|nr:Translocon-associated protein beta [Ancylostoma duodenale]KIH51568.1 Translocon-associated protein beta [Ancylostoma duodenale]
MLDLLNVKDAFIVASKFPQSIYAVENMDLVLEYGLYNTGDKAALKVWYRFGFTFEYTIVVYQILREFKVTLDDRHSFPTQSFEIIKGLLNVRFERINPGANATHSVVVSIVACAVVVVVLLLFDYGSV